MRMRSYLDIVLSKETVEIAMDMVWKMISGLEHSSTATGNGNNHFIFIRKFKEP